jgi:hypothetical protein
MERGDFENMTQHYLTAQKAIDGLKLNFKSKKARPVYEKLHPSGRQNAACDCCGKDSPSSRLAKIDSGQKICPDCLNEMRQ